MLLGWNIALEDAELGSVARGNTFTTSLSVLTYAGILVLNMLEAAPAWSLGLSLWSAPVPLRCLSLLWVLKI